MSKNERLQALQILVNMIEQKTALTNLLHQDKTISPLSKAICYGVCRHYFRLQVLLDSLVDKRVKELDLMVVLLIGLYQLQYLNRPEYASVQETVALLDKLKKSWAKGLVNAVLRRFCRERLAIIAKAEELPDYIMGHPQWFISCLQTDWPLHWSMILKGNDEHPPMSLRVNQQRVHRDAYLQRLTEAGIKAEKLPFSEVGIRLESPVEVNELPGFAEGDISIQDEAAQLAVPFLALKPGLRVLDACCAPGGKTCHMLESQPALAECVALDVDERRLQRVKENLARLHLKATVLQGSALLPATWWDGQLFDRILLDAPCSATGVIRRHPDIKLLRTKADIDDISAIQATMLRSLWPLLKPGGLLVYATCSVIKQENEEQIANFSSIQADCKLQAPEQTWGQFTGHGLQLLPGYANCDGFFYSILSKTE